VGFIGLGKLGLPCAAALSVKAGIRVNGFDVNPQIAQYISQKSVPYQEERIEEFLELADIRFYESFETFLDDTDLIFVAVQTPHEPRFEGSSPVPTETSDFDYTFLKATIASVAQYLKKNPLRNLTISVVSTVLPGTMEKDVLPEFLEVINQVKFCYNPFFIAMGTTIMDYLDPEFVLLGENNEDDGLEVIELYSLVHSAPIRKMKIESAELTKVAYNTFIGFKIVFANTLAEIVDQRGGDVDEVTGALGSANQRLISPKYLRAGMADGGGCHPRDQIAMSWLAKEANLSANIFDFLARARDAQTRRQAELISNYHKSTRYPVCILGKAYKAEVNLTVGSPALLLASFLEEMGIEVRFYDPICDPASTMPEQSCVFFVATNHKVFLDLELPSGSIVIDPWGNAINFKDDVKIVQPGRFGMK
jgi:UDPglucose 6-dehydrogenase